MARKKPGFNAPFAKLKARRPESDRPADPPKRTPEPPGHSPDDPAPDPEDEAALFAQWVGEVRPLSGKTPLRHARPTPTLSAAVQDLEDAETLAELSELVGGGGEFELADTQEWIEGLAPGIDRKLLRRLKRGEFSLQAHLDLHGMVRDEAKLAVRTFVKDARRLHWRCVLIIHGRGLGSPGGHPVLKTALTHWLSRGELGRQVLAFCTARQDDGGAGAVYVLLRR